MTIRTATATGQVTNPGPVNTAYLLELHAQVFGALSGGAVLRETVASQSFSLLPGGVRDHSFTVAADVPALGRMEAWVSLGLTAPSVLPNYALSQRTIYQELAAPPAPVPPIVSGYLAQIAAATTKTALDSIRALFEAAYAARLLTDAEYLTLFNAYVARWPMVF